MCRRLGLDQLDLQVEQVERAHAEHCNRTCADSGIDKRVVLEERFWMDSTYFLT
jgi:hypothetical protein